MVLACAGLPAAPTGWVDRIEGETAVLLVEDADGGLSQRDVPLSSLPPAVREGDRVVDGQVDPEARRRQALRVRALQQALFGPPPGTD